MTRRLGAALALALVALGLPARAAASGPPALEPPSPEALAEARRLVDSMTRADRGPYKWLRWWCNDGTVHPPKPYPCGDRGGGRQHAEYSADRARLAELGWHVGTIVTALGWQELWDEGHRHARLRELPVEMYLIDSADGWVLRRARYYRGRVQVEDEEDAGYKLLVQLLARNDWVAQEFLLAREAARTLPHHGGGGDRTRTVRRLSKTLADREPSYFDIRVKIHTRPGPEDLQSTRAWLAEHRATLSAEDASLADQLLAEMVGLFGTAGRRERLDAGLHAFTGRPLHRELAPLVDGVVDASPREQVRRLSRLMAACRDALKGSTQGRSNVVLMDLSLEAEALLRQAVFRLLDAAPSRGELAGVAVDLSDAAYGTGLLSGRERQALAAPMLRLLDEPAASPAAYLSACRGLERCGAWAASTIRHAFAEPLVRYGALEPQAAQFVDDLLRGSVLLPLAEVAGRLARDAEREAGLRHSVFGNEASGLAGLNPGVSVGRLRVLAADEIGRRSSLRDDEIAVLPSTVPDLPPVAGILTVAEGNVLSHVQVLARNLGIPNVTIPPAASGALAAHDGETVLLAVSSRGAVVLARVADLPPAVVAGLEQDREAAARAAKVAAPSPDLTVTDPLRLSELRSGLSGVVVGPKAANLGELARLYPERVAPAIALPFGLFARHAARGEGSPKARLDRAFARHRGGVSTDDELWAEVESVRASVEALRLSPDTRSRLEALMAAEFGPPGTYGLFVRSDTNVEDLPGFTGAGLNKTVPNVVGFDEQLAAVPKVWASPFRQRAMGWRARALSNPEEVYPSVLLMKSVPADKSGVLVTKDLVGSGEGLTVAAAWGVGGAVDGEAAETLVLRPGGGVELVGEAKAPYARRLPASGGVDWVASPAGQVLAEPEVGALRELAATLAAELPTALTGADRRGALDVEFGFVDGELVLFQVRPLVERGADLADAVTSALRPRTSPPAGSLVDLSRRPTSPSGPPS